MRIRVPLIKLSISSANKGGEMMLNGRGRRIIYDRENGNIIAQIGEVTGLNTAEHNPINTLDYIDLEFGFLDYNKQEISGIDISTKKPIIIDIATITDEQKQIKELEEDVELLKADAEKGGIL